MFNPHLFKQEIPSYHPATDEYISFWREEKRKCIEGTFEGGYFMPPKLYFYQNYGTIKLNTSVFSKQKVFARPLIRDVELKIFRGLTAARGFSGFSEDPIYTSLEIANNPPTEELYEYLCAVHPEAIHNSQIKKYISPIENLSLSYPFPRGYPLYKNPAKNLAIVTPRAIGKSWSTANIVQHEYLFDGLDAGTDGIAKYTPGQIATTGITVGAADSKYSLDLLTKFKDAYDLLPGKVTISNETYPSPFSKQFVGSLKSGSEIINKVRKKVGRNWVESGTKTSIYHRTFQGNPFAAQGLRSSLMVFEESGMFDNLKACFLNSAANMESEGVKFGTAIFIGTGGDMSGGSTLDFQDMFFNPDRYSILSFPDEWENKSRIGLFIPATFKANHFKDEYGNTDHAKALSEELLKRSTLTDTKASDALNAYVQYNPLIPSEAFLSSDTNVFPVSEIKSQLTNILNNSLYEKLTNKVTLYYDPQSPSQVTYSLDLENKLHDISTFPHKDSESLEGAVVIYEFPQTINGEIPKNAYIIGHDPFATDSTTGQSLATIFVLKTKKYAHLIGHDEIVAVYRGRPYNGRNAVNEILLKLSLFYGNAKIFFENAVGNVKEYFEKNKRLDLLATQPRTVLTKKASYNQAEPLIYGYPMANQTMKHQAIQYVRDWLLEEHHRVGDAVYRNVDLIPDRRLLQQMLNFSFEMNADDVMGFAGCIIGLTETQNQFKKELEKPKDHFIATNPTLFQPKPLLNVS